MLTPSEFLGQDGPLAKHIEGFAPRPQQQQMAQAVAEALDNYQVLVTEAGTGTGKTYAYLVPALLSGGKIIISTGTKTLQDQLFHRDLPLVRKALGVSVTTAMLKGRANYLCKHRLLMAEQSGMGSRRVADQLHRVRSWAGRTQVGDIAEVTDIAEDSPIWYQVTSTTDNCLGQECPEFSDCHVMKARRAAQEADVLVVNHHLFFADMMLKEEGFGDLLPGANAFILDEAHQLPEIASNFFGTFLSSRQLFELSRDVVVEYLREAGDTQGFQEYADLLEKAVRDFRLALGIKLRRAAWSEVEKQADVKNTLAVLVDSLSDLQTNLEQVAERGKGLENCLRRCVELKAQLEFLTDTSSESSIAWFEITKRAFMLRHTPLDVAELFQNCKARYKCAWVYTSATLAIGDNFNHFTARLGIDDAETGLWDSPFDFKNNALLYLPKNMPDPRESHYTSQVMKAALPVVQASGGRTFILFTSHRALKEAALLLNESDIEYPVLVQGSLPRSGLLDRFRALGNAILLGTSSFWEGVDVRGSALSCVIIDKLPFASPDDPVLKARTDAIKKQGGNAFMDYLLPNSVISLKQGVGRLIRDIDDRGVLMLCDPRVLSKSYGKIFLNNLPPITRTRDIKDVQQFFAQEQQQELQQENILKDRFENAEIQESL